MRFAPGTWRYAGPALLLSALALFVSAWLSLALLAAAGFVLWFFRDPERSPPPAGIVSPADGRVTVVREEDGRVRVGVFMRVRDVHVNRAPLAGTVESVEHTPGAHRPAFSKESERNERVRVAFDAPDVDAFEVVLIAGWFARRITPYVDPEDEIERGERIGHVAFGSRADVILPAAVDPADLRVETGDSVRAGETIIAAGP